MSEQNFVMNPKEPYKTFFIGRYEYICKVGNRERRMITYIPEGARASTSGVYLFPPGGVTADDFLSKSNWKELADTEEHREKFVLFVFESSPGEKWDVDEAYGAQGGDLEYVWNCYRNTLKRSLCCVYEGKRYVVGYRDGGTIAAKFVMDNPADIAGLALVDALPVDGTYMNEASEALCPRLGNYVDEDCKRGIKKGEIPTRAIVISSNDARELPEVHYWCNANRDAKEPRKVEMNIWEYYRTVPMTYPVDEERDAYCVWVMQMDHASENYGRLVNRTIWKKFLYPVIRWNANPGGSFRFAKDPVFDLKMEYHYEEIDGWMREWYVHVPESVKKDPDTAVPLVFVPHGYTCTGEICVGNADWYKVADKYGFIVAFPTALNGLPDKSENQDEEALDGAISDDNCPLPAWNIFDAEGLPKELDFFIHMYQDICEHHAIDKSRVYMTGTSHGNLMTQYMALKRPELFAAVAPTSGVLYMAGGEKMLELEEVKNRRQVDLPIWMFGGEMEPFLLAAVPAIGNPTGDTIRVWWELNDMPEKLPETFEGLERKTRGRWNDWIFVKNRMPMIRWTGIDYYPHAVNPEMSYRIWEEFFSKFKREEDGTLTYWEGEA